MLKDIECAGRLLSALRFAGYGAAVLYCIMRRRYVAAVAYFSLRDVLYMRAGV